tara:strand:- start:79 stop:282 length:204 start_codon:yes stop_codon:yes gene_type:complete
MTIYNTSQERDEAINEMFEASPVYDKSKAMWEAENRAAAAAGEMFEGTSYYDAAFDSWTEARYGYRF